MPTYSFQCKYRFEVQNFNTPLFIPAASIGEYIPPPERGWVGLSFKLFWSSGAGIERGTCCFAESYLMDDSTSLRELESSVLSQKEQ